MSGRAAPANQMHVCTRCASSLVHPIDWNARGLEGWYVELRCPNCELVRTGLFTQGSIDDFDEELDQGTAGLERELNLLTRANMREYADRFIAALALDAIQPVDF